MPLVFSFVGPSPAEAALASPHAAASVEAPRFLTQASTQSRAIPCHVDYESCQGQSQSQSHRGK